MHGAIFASLTVGLRGTGRRFIFAAVGRDVLRVSEAAPSNQLFKLFTGYYIHSPKILAQESTRKSHNVNMRSGVDILRCCVRWKDVSNAERGTQNILLHSLEEHVSL